MVLYKKYLVVILAIVVVGGSFVVGFEMGKISVPEVDKVEGLINKETGKPMGVDFVPFWKAWNTLETKFVPTTASATRASTDRKIWEAISGLTRAYGDPYTIFLPPQENNLFKEDISGNFEGVGMEIGKKDDTLIVIAPLKGSPAERAGIKTGDMILEIDGFATADMTTEEAVTMIRGKKGTIVRLTIFRKDNGQTSETVSIMRDTIIIPTLETDIHVSPNGNKIFVIRLYSFSANSLDLFRNALIELSKADTNKLLLDLRGNPGGYLEAAVDMASWFLPEGRVVVREYYGEGIKEEVHRSRGYDIFTNALRMVILVDSGSASASEILAGALREHGIAKLVGVKTFGKGSVQELVDITEDTSLKITVARWLTPDGVSLSDGGLEPDVTVDMTREDAEKERDPQFDKAVDILNR